MTAYEVIAFGRYPYLDWSVRLGKKDEEIIASAIENVHVSHLMDQKLHELSDGQLQMVMIARALAQDTPIILLDEPTAHLDLNNRVEVMKLLKRLSRTTNKAILVATHELDLALQLSDWIWLTGKNKEIITGIPEELVLDGSFDAIFQFKGFDLKTGKIQHEAHKGIAVSLTGEGYEVRWTKNALERNGFHVSDQLCAISINVIREKDLVQWQLQQPGAEKVFSSLSQLINSI
jgi:iron complex transport system ATP-binding protein